MKKINFTEASIKSIATPAKRTEYQDSTYCFWRLRVSPSGAKSFEVFKRLKGGTNKRISIGRFDQGITVKEAKQLALDMAGVLSKGIDPSGVKSELAAKRVTLKATFNQYMLDKKLKEKTVREYNSLFKNYLVPLESKGLLEITRKDIEDWYKAIKSESQAAGSLRLLNAIFNYATDEYIGSDGRSLVKDNPTKVIAHKGLKHRPKRKQTHIRSNQIESFFKVLESLRKSGTTITQRSICDAMVFALYTGLRKEEILNLKWSDVKESHFTINNNKSDRPLELPITSSLARIIHRDRFITTDYVFPAENPTGKIIEPKKVVAKVKELSGCDCNWHDLRRTFLTIGEGLGIGTYMLKRLANHALTSDVTEGYLVLTGENLRESSERIHNQLDQFVKSSIESI